MFRRLSILTVAALALPLVPVSAQSPNPRLDLSFEGKLTSSCVNKRVGSVVTYHEQSTMGLGRETTEYGFVEEPLSLACAAAWGFSAGVEYRLSRTTAVGISVSHTSSSSALKRSVTSAPGTTTWIQIAGWGDPNLTPVGNSKTGGLSPIDFHAEDDQRWLELDVRATRTLHNDGKYRVSASAGLSYTRFSHRSNTGETQTAYAGGVPGISYTNHITLESSAISNGTMIGPRFGMAVTRKMGPLSTEVGVNGAVMKSSTNVSGRFDDVDDIVLQYETRAGSTPFYYVQYKGLSTYESSLGKWVSNANLRLKTSTKLSLLRVAVGAEMSYWGGMVTAPFFMDPWALGSGSKAPTGIRWDPQERNIMRTSLFLSVGTSF